MTSNYRKRLIVYLPVHTTLVHSEHTKYLFFCANFIFLSLVIISFSYLLILIDFLLFFLYLRLCICINLCKFIPPNHIVKQTVFRCWNHYFFAIFSAFFSHTSHVFFFIVRLLSQLAKENAVHSERFTDWEGEWKIKNIKARTRKTKRKMFAHQQ